MTLKGSKILKKIKSTERIPKEAARTLKYIK